MRQSFLKAMLISQAKLEKVETFRTAYTGIT